MHHRLALGTVQFGLPYGLSRPDEPTSPDEVRTILGVAGDHGIDLLDTAAAYGESERVLGAAVTDGFRIVTKLPPLTDATSIGDREIEQLRTQFDASLEHLRRDSVYGLLVHHAPDLFKPGGERIWRLMKRWRDAGRVTKIGVSVYDPSDVSNVTDTVDLQLIQAPISAFDQRLVRNGMLDALAQDGVEVHVRSVFLQGLVVRDPDTLPRHFDSIRGHLDFFRESLSAAGLTPVQAALGYPHQLDAVAKVVIGVDDAAQLRQNLDAVAPDVLERLSELPWEEFALEDERFYDPRQWPSA